MRYLYKGKTKIGKIHMKTKVDTSFITAGPDDIVAGKKTINGNYEEITGTMDVNSVVTDLTSDATATAADITAGKTGWANGKKLTGTTVRDISKLLMSNGIVDTYKVKNGSNISSGDFITIEESVTGTIQHTPGTSQFTVIPDVSVFTNGNLINLTDNVSLLIYNNDISIRIFCRFIYSDGVNVSLGEVIQLDVGILPKYMFATKLSDNTILLSINTETGSMCKLLTINNTFTTVSSTISYNYSSDVTSISSIARLTNNSAILTYVLSNSRELYARIVSINNNVLTFSTPSKISDGYITVLKSSEINQSTCIVSYVESGVGHVRTLQISDNNIIVDADNPFGFYIVGYMDMIKLSDTKFIIFHTNSELVNSSAIILNYSNGLKMSNSQGINLALTNMTSVALSPNKIIMMYYNAKDGYYVKYFIVDIDSKNTISYGEHKMLNYSRPDFRFMVKTGDNSVLTIHSGIVPAPPATGIYSVIGMLQINGKNISNIFGEYTTKTEYLVDKYTVGKEINGIANTSGSSGEMIQVILPHVTE